ncbi:hypothetical protein [Nonomuraea sp. SBT364]|uniref:hypothetical protein n=1 Tax=Nonomuraea sp. SBT364 TaxID=1580530 RepID=UPI00066B459F|nr:hypothetical protein [Nonomuraea sp. SBT364]
MRGAGPDLERLVRRVLMDAGFTVEPAPVPADGGLSVWREPGRGVVIRWDLPALGDGAGGDTIRVAVRLALRAVLSVAGFEVSEDGDRPEMVVLSSP